MKRPDFNEMLAVLKGEKPSRPVLFEFFLNEPLYKKLAGVDDPSLKQGETFEWHCCNITAYHKAGYDFATIGTGFCFPKPEIHKEDTISLNDGVMISDRKSFEKYPWPIPDEANYALYGQLKKVLPDGMKIIACGPGGVLENVISLAGYDNLCMMLADDPKLVQDIFDAVGSRLVRHYEICCSFDTVGAAISNDDWGFKSQTMLSPADMRKYVIPWHIKIVETIHSYRKPAILHSCGNLVEVMDDIIDVIKYEAKHSYEDVILPVEDAYEKWGSRIAILGGIDIDFLMRNTPEKIRDRSKNMLERTKSGGGYALGSGNSIPQYVPDEKYFAMISAANIR